ncbi:MAG: DUF935 domain-containing protein [Carboxylicivirga sp.]|nr:DUF935 domain-containing protein [Carboxylicivirga sp.]
MLDAHLLSVIGKRRAKVTNARLRFFNHDGTENDIINELIDTESAENMIKDIIDSRFYGHSLLWFNGITDERIDYQLIERSHVKPSTREVLTRPYDLHGVSYAEGNTANYVLEVGDPKDLGLLVTTAIWVIYKKGGVSDFALFAESFGSPFREYIYQDPTTKTALEKAAKNSQAGQYVVRPAGSEFKLHESGQKSGSKDLFVGLKDVCDEQISKAILHNTMTTDALGGNYKGEVHQESEKEVSKADKRFVTRVLNERFKPVLASFGFQVDGKFMYEEEDPIPIEKRFDIDMKFAEKFEVEADYFYNKYRVPIPKSGAAYKQATKPDAEPEKKEEEESGKKKTKKKVKQKKLSEQSFFQRLFSFLPWVE